LYTLTLISFGEKTHIKTAHHIDIDTRQVFEDILSFRKFNYRDEMDLENFLAVKGRLVSECIPQLQLDNNDKISAVPASEKFKSIKNHCPRVYSHNLMLIADYIKILDPVCAAVTAKTTISAAFIRNSGLIPRGLPRLKQIHACKNMVVNQTVL
jgi:hypothetical protein